MNQVAESSHTIEDGERLFKTRGGYFSQELGNIGQTVREKFPGRTPPLDTGFHPHTLAWTRQLLERTHESFHMLTGSDYLARSMQADFRSMLLRLMRKNGEAKIIVLDGDLGVFNMLQKEFPETLQAKGAIKVNPEQSISHYMVSDGEFLRDEEPHEPISPAMPLDAIDAKMFLHNASMGRLFDKRFEVHWEMVTGEKKKEEQKRKWWQIPWKKNDYSVNPMDEGKYG